MDENSGKEKESKQFNAIDLTALEDFSFGTQWTSTRSDDDSSRQRPSRERGGDRTSGRSGEPGRRDRRGNRRPTRSYSGDDRGGGGEGAGDRGRPHHGRRGGARGEFGGRRPFQDNRPYMSPVFSVAFYPEDQGFSALVKAMRNSCRTYELFEIARLILEKSERCVVVFRRQASGDEKNPPLFLSVPDSVPFETEEEALSHAIEAHLERFFTIEEVEAEPPKGNFQFVNRCPFTKELLGPPNYHRYPHILQQHYTAHLANRMSFDKFKGAVEVVKDPEVVAQWLEKMKTVTRFVVKNPLPEEPTTFDSIEDARAYLIRTARPQLVRQSDTARVAAKDVEAAHNTEAFRAMEGARDRQRRFPLDTANSLRGRLRRENFHIFKRGSKGITYVTSVKRKFRIPGQTFSDSIERLIQFIEANPMIEVKDLPEKLLGFAQPVPAPDQTAEEAESSLSDEQKLNLKRLGMDLRWLVTEGYVTEFSDGKLFASPPLPPAAQNQPPAPTPSKEEADESDSADAKSEEEKPQPEAAESSVEADAKSGDGEAPAPESSTEAKPVAEAEASEESDSEKVAAAEAEAGMDQAQETAPAEPVAEKTPAEPAEPEAPAGPKPELQPEQ